MCASSGALRFDLGKFVDNSGAKEQEKSFYHVIIIVFFDWGIWNFHVSRAICYRFTNELSCGKELLKFPAILRVRIFPFLRLNRQKSLHECSWSRLLSMLL